MAGTFSKIYIHIVFSVHSRENLIAAGWEGRLHKYITGIVTKKGQKLLAINGMPDHIHLLVGMEPACSVSDLVREIKKSSNEFIKEQRLTRTRFSWQTGFGAFSYGKSQVDDVIKYILNQKQHHARRDFQEEYKALLERFEVEFDEKYIFD
jgi:REP element-mobilizing transposase RayT